MVRDEARLVVGLPGLLSERLSELVGEHRHVFLGLLADDDLHARHDWDGVHEVETDDLALAFGHGRDGRDRECGSVRREHDVLRNRLVEVREDVLLDVHVLHGGLHDHVAVREVGELRRPRDAVDGSLCLALAQFVLGHEAVQRGLDGVEAGFDVLRLDVAHHDVVALGGGDLGDAGTHRARADDADRLDVCEVSHTRGWDGPEPKGAGNVETLKPLRSHHPANRGTR